MPTSISFAEILSLLHRYFVTGFLACNCGQHYPFTRIFGLELIELNRPYFNYFILLFECFLRKRRVRLSSNTLFGQLLSESNCALPCLLLVFVVSSFGACSRSIFIRTVDSWLNTTISRFCSKIINTSDTCTIIVRQDTRFICLLRFGVVPEVYVSK